MKKIVGIAASSGKAMAKCIGLDQYLECDKSKLTEHFIIVSDALPPYITSMDEHVVGIIAEDGGILSHAACIAREFCIPCIVSVDDAKEMLIGKTVEIDGSEGTICILTM